MSQILVTLLVVLVICMGIITIMMCINMISIVISNRIKIEEDKKNIIVEL